MAQEQLDSLENEFLPFLPRVKESGKKAVSCENNLFVQNRSTNAQNMETWQKKKIVYKKTDEWYIEWQRVTTNDNEWYNE